MKLFSSQTSLVSYFPISAFAQSQRLKTSVSSLFDTTVCCQLYFIFPQQYLHTLPHIIPIPSLIVHTTLLFILILTVAFYQVSNDFIIIWSKITNTSSAFKELLFPWLQFKFSKALPQLIPSLIHCSPASILFCCKCFKYLCLPDTLRPHIHVDISVWYSLSPLAPPRQIHYIFPDAFWC